MCVLVLKVDFGKICFELFKKKVLMLQKEICSVCVCMCMIGSG